MTQSNATKMERILNRREIAYIITDKDGDIMHSSPEYTALTKYASFELRGQNPRILQGTETSTRQKTQIREFVKKAATDKKFLIQNYTRTGEMFWNSLYMVPILNFDGQLEKWIAASVDATELRAELQLKPVVQSAIDTCRRVERMLRSVLHSLGPIFGSPGWERGVPDDEFRQDLGLRVNLRSDEEFLGEIKQYECCCDLAVRSRELPEASASMYAGDNGAVLVTLTRQTWLQAQALEPISFLRRMPRFNDMLNSQLAPISTKMHSKSLDRGVVLCSTGQVVSKVWFVREGMIDLRIRVGKDNKPLKQMQVGSKERTSTLRQPATQSFAVVGAGDVVDQAQLVNGVWVAQCDAVALTGRVSLYELDRSIMPWLATDGGVHSASVMEPRTRQRRRHLQCLDEAAVRKTEMMAPNKFKPDGSADLGWGEGYRLPPGVKLKEFAAVENSTESPVCGAFVTRSPFLPPSLLSNVVFPPMVPKVRPTIEFPQAVPVSPLPEGRFREATTPSRGEADGDNLKMSYDEFQTAWKSGDMRRGKPTGRTMRRMRSTLEGTMLQEENLDHTFKLPVVQGLDNVDLDAIDENDWHNVIGALDDTNAWTTTERDMRSLNSMWNSELESIMQYNTYQLTKLEGDFATGEVDL